MFRLKFIYLKILFFIFLGFLFVFLVLNVFLSFNLNYKTEIIYRDNFEKKINVCGLIFKDEKILNYCNNGEIIKNIYKDGSHVAANSEIARKYYREMDIKNLNRIEKIDDKMKSLKEAQRLTRVSNQNFNDLNSQIYKNYYDFRCALKNGDSQSCNNFVKEIINYLNRKQLLVGKVDNFENSIENFKKEKISISKLISSRPKVIKTSISGYISSKIDGFENECSLENMNRLSVEQIQQIYDRCEKNKNALKFGNKIIYNPIIFLKAILPNEVIIDCKVGSKCSLNFQQTGEEIDAELVELNLGKKNKKGLATFRINQMTEKLSYVRNSKVEIKFKNYYGLKIKKIAIRKNEKNQTGVYVKIGSVVRFKLVDILTEGSDFIISKIHDDDENYVRELDEIIVKGKDLYDRKRIK